MSRMPSELFDELLCLKAEILRYYESCQCAGETGDTAGSHAHTGNADERIPDYDRLPETSAQLTDIFAGAAAIRARGDCISLKELAVTGGDLIAAGMKPGREIGAVLAELLDLVLEQPEKNTKEELMRHVSGLAGE